MLDTGGEADKLGPFGGIAHSQRLDAPLPLGLVARLGDFGAAGGEEFLFLELDPLPRRIPQHHVEAPYPHPHPRPLVCCNTTHYYIIDYVSGYSMPYPANPLIIGAGKRIRTSDLLITNQLLYRLSYSGICRGAV